MIPSVMMFGSGARGDIGGDSDIDLLIVSDLESISIEKRAGVEIQYLPSKYLMKMASDGELFAIHLAVEGKVVIDPSNYFLRFRERIRIRPEYRELRSHASSLAWFLLEHGRSLEDELRNKRVAWCVRTILISLLVEQGRLIFSPSGISTAFPGVEISELIELRRSNKSFSDTEYSLREFIGEFGNPRPKLKGVNDYVSYFSKKKNSVAISTLRSLGLIQLKSGDRTRESY